MQKKYQKIIDFIRETFHQPEEFIPLHAPVFSGNEKEYLLDCIDTTFVSSVGEYVDKFEIEIAKYTSSAAAVVCVNGTNALHMALLLAGVKPNDEVLTQPLSFVATTNAISYCGAKPVFIDVDIDSLGLSPVALKFWLEKNTIQKKEGCFNKNTGKKISACVPMHTFGQPCRIDEIVEICSSFNIDVIEDAAESLGSFYKNKHTGTFGKIGVLSFNGNKIVTSGGGGMLLFNDKKLAKRAKHITTQAKVPHKWEFIHDETAYNYRMPNINAALGLAQLEKIDLFVSSKRNLAKKYKTFFESVDVPCLTEIESARANYWLNAIYFNESNERDNFLEFSNKNGVMTRPAWKLLNTLPMYVKCETGDITNAQSIAKRLVNIPSSVIL